MVDVHVTSPSHASICCSARDSPRRQTAIPMLGWNGDPVTSVPFLPQKHRSAEPYCPHRSHRSTPPSPQSRRPVTLPTDAGPPRCVSFPGSSNDPAGGCTAAHKLPQRRPPGHADSTPVRQRRAALLVPKTNSDVDPRPYNEASPLRGIAAAQRRSRSQHHGLR